MFVPKVGQGLIRSAKFYRRFFAGKSYRVRDLHDFAFKILSLKAELFLIVCLKYLIGYMPSVAEMIEIIASMSI